jgi:tetratricopeptide (TPR) repeat protein
VFQGQWNTLAELKTKADAGDLEAAVKVGKILSAREDYAGAAAYFAKALPKDATAGVLLADAEIGILEQKLHAVAGTGDEAGARTNLLQRVEKAVSEYPALPAAIGWHRTASEIHEKLGHPDQRAKHLLSIVVLAEQLGLDSKNLKGSDLQITDLWQEAASASEASGNEVMAKHFWKRAAMGLAKVRSAGRSGERAIGLDRAHCLWKSGDVDGAEKLYRSLEASYPKEFTFYYAHARMNQDLKKFDVAAELASKALKFSYGDNKLRAVKLAGEVALAQSKAQEALPLVRETLSSVKGPDDSSVRTHRYLKQLRELEAKLAAAPAAK